MQQESRLNELVFYYDTHAVKRLSVLARERKGFILQYWISIEQVYLVYGMACMPLIDAVFCLNSNVRMKGVPLVRPINKHCGCQNREWRSCIVDVCSHFRIIWNGITATLLSGRRSDSGTIVCVSLNMSRGDCKVKRMPYWRFLTASPTIKALCQHLQLQLFV